MIILGIESTAHTFGVGIVNHKGKVLANAKSSYSSPEHGMIPNEIAEHHKKVAPTILKQALTQANLTLNQINLLAYSAGPGLDPGTAGGGRAARARHALHRPPVGRRGPREATFPR